MSLNKIQSDLSSIDFKSDKINGADDAKARTLAQAKIEEMHGILKKGMISQEEFDGYVENIKEMVKNQDADISILNDQFVARKNEIVKDAARAIKDGKQETIVTGTFKKVLYTPLGIEDDLEKNNEYQNYGKGVIDELMALPEVVELLVTNHQARLQLLEALKNLSWEQIKDSFHISVENAYEAGGATVFTILLLSGIGALLKTGSKLAGKIAGARKLKAKPQPTPTAPSTPSTPSAKVVEETAKLKAMGERPKTPGLADAGTAEVRSILNKKGNLSPDDISKLDARRVLLNTEAQSAGNNLKRLEAIDKEVKLIDSKIRNSQSGLNGAADSARVFDQNTTAAAAVNGIKSSNNFIDNPVRNGIIAATVAAAHLQRGTRIEAGMQSDIATATATATESAPSATSAPGSASESAPSAAPASSALSEAPRNPNAYNESSLDKYKDRINAVISKLETSTISDKKELGEKLKSAAAKKLNKDDVTGIQAFMITKWPDSNISGNNKPDGYFGEKTMSSIEKIAAEETEVVISTNTPTISPTVQAPVAPVNRPPVAPIIQSTAPAVTPSPSSGSLNETPTISMKPGRIKDLILTLNSIINFDPQNRGDYSNFSHDELLVLSQLNWANVNYMKEQLRIEAKTTTNATSGKEREHEQEWLGYINTLDRAIISYRGQLKEITNISTRDKKLLEQADQVLSQIKNRDS